ncbi:hypothetical protein [Galactobacter caseinivorans]|uniref:Uncharacterized protein n=1 Tax=Galactobacter caseinivorans TaxID=2676123 RepID=A0A496PMT8_9MICC|nr:hypothetical protein [Galactobacter caseinivorans]RKW71789.1 hypothetical protein DWQ67_02875 [Galactobacter caseinivorans]
MTTTDYERRIAQANPGLRKGKVQRLANRIAKRAASGIAAERARIQEMGESAWFENQLRILGIHADTTARDAVAIVEAGA